MTLAHFIIPIAGLLCLTPWISSGLALILGLVLALTVGNPYILHVKNWTHKLLAISIIGLGFGMDLSVIAKAGMDGLGFTIVSISGTILLGTLLGKLLKTDKDTSLLVTVGTAICGGSAIAAVAPVIKAKHHDVTVSLGIVFLLNAAALFVFPWVGHAFDIPEVKFGLWSALAIHDTSSVVGATLQYGPKALDVGTTVKLTRALWIVPVAMMIGFWRSRTTKEKVTGQKAKRPWFILGFILAAAFVTVFPQWKAEGHMIEGLAKRLMVLTLFFIGSGLTRETIKNVGIRPLIQGFVLWVIVATVSLLTIMYVV